MKMVWFRRNTGVALNERKLAEMKEKATGSPTLGRQDFRLTGSKALGLALAAGLALGVGAKAIEFHHAQIEAKKAAVENVLKKENADRIAVLRKAGAPASMEWAEALKANKALADYFNGSIKPLTPDDLRLIRQMVSRGESHGPMAMHLIMSALKVVNPYAKTPEDFEYERRNIRNAVNFIMTDWDWPLSSEASALTTYIEENNHKPEFRKLLLKLRSYSQMQIYPFDPTPEQKNKS